MYYCYMCIPPSLPQVFLVVFFWSFFFREERCFFLGSRLLLLLLLLLLSWRLKCLVFTLFGCRLAGPYPKQKSLFFFGGGEGLDSIKKKKKKRWRRTKEEDKPQTAFRTAFFFLLLSTAALKNPSRLLRRVTSFRTHLNVVTNHVCCIHDYRRRGESFYRRKIGRVQEKRDRVAEQERAIGTRAIWSFFFSFASHASSVRRGAMIPCISFRG